MRFGRYRAPAYYISVRGRSDGRGGALGQRLYATDGTQVRLMRSESTHLSLRQNCAPSSARRLAEVIRDGWRRADPLMGFEAHRTKRTMAFVETADGKGRPWVALELDDERTQSELGTLPFPDDDEPSLRLVAGVECREDGGLRYADVAVEARGRRFREQPEASGLLGHVATVGLTGVAPGSRRGEPGRVGQLEPKLREVGLSREDAVEPSRVDANRLEARFSLDPRVAAAFRDEPNCHLWLVVTFEPDYLAVPPPWRRFWIDLGTFQS